MDHFAHAHYLPGSVDSHCHLSIMEQKGLPVDLILQDCVAAQMSHVVDVGISIDDLPNRRARFGTYPIVRFTAGVHPMNAATWDDHGLLEKHVTTGDVLAIGETGLDWYRGRDTADAQVRAFEAQLHLARRLDLPVVIHNRDATDDVYHMVRNITPPAGGVMHCYSASAQWVARFVDLGFSISFAGNVTYKNAAELRDAARVVPSDRILSETDAPYLSPIPARGKPNHPGYVSHTIRVLAEVRGASVDALIEQIAANTRALFRLPPV